MIRSRRREPVRNRPTSQGLASAELVSVATRDKDYERWEADFLEP